MNVRILAALLISLSIQPVFAAGERKEPAQGSLMEGTPEEQAACAPDAKRFCKEDLSDTFKVLACLQDNRSKLRKVCQKVLEDNGQ